MKDGKDDEYWTLLKAHVRDENMLLKKISKSVVSYFRISSEVYQTWIESFVDEDENITKLQEFKDTLRKDSYKALETPRELSKEDCLAYAKSFQDKICLPQAELLIK